MTPPGRRLAVGLISGTSMDGIDAALVELSGQPEEPAFRLRAFRTTPYPAPLRRRLLRVAGSNATTAAEIGSLHYILGRSFAEATLAICRMARIRPHRLTVIGSHGQTVFHRGSGRDTGLPASTVQLGEPSIIAERTGAPVVADFRSSDIAAGGQGAPLVPLVDYLLFRNSQSGVAALNIGGIANVTIVPAQAEPTDVFGFDTGPGNMVVDELVRYLTKGRKDFDAEGGWARQGAVLKPLLERMLRSPFFRRKPPKSAGREQFGWKFVSRHLLHQKATRPEDLLRTATELTALSIATALRRFAMPNVQIDRVIVSGGGAHNRLLLGRLRNLLPGIGVRPSDDYGIPVDAKEAVAFALLADRTIRGLPGNLPSVTGARRPVVLGKLVRV